MFALRKCPALIIVVGLLCALSASAYEVLPAETGDSIAPLSPEFLKWQAEQLSNITPPP